jgi:hypothetical protein
MDYGQSDQSSFDANLPSNRPVLVGWKERLDFVAWHLHSVKVKIDTGARTSALDALRYELFENGQTGPFARLFLSLDARDPQKISIVEAPLLSKIVVRNSGGFCEERPLIETEIRLGPVQKRIRITVTRRHSMRFRVLLGRNGIADDFVVDPSKKYLLRRRQ